MTLYSRRQTLRLGFASLAALPLLALGTRRAMAATHQVEIKGFKFSPASLQVAVGDTVMFTNKDGAPHTATATDGSFDTGTVKKNKTGSITITAAGAHAYKCRFHPNMKGTITAA